MSSGAVVSDRAWASDRYGLVTVTVDDVPEPNELVQVTEIGFAPVTIAIEFVPSDVLVIVALFSVLVTVQPVSVVVAGNVGDVAAMPFAVTPYTTF
ncbi:MAG: hypothetical protein HY827_07880 [Actinobacteria bacterium]|nr:hypothetical protein [Actinomycetota bacterium]